MHREPPPAPGADEQALAVIGLLVMLVTASLAFLPSC